MSKLPAEFVKAPTPAKQPKPRAPRARKASLISPEPVTDPRVLSLTLTDEELAALEEARQTLAQAGSQITLEQMIHRVFADWMVRARAVVEAAPAPAEPAREDTTPSATTAPRETNAMRDEVVARLRAFVAAPLRMWRQLARQAWHSAIARYG